MLSLSSFDTFSLFGNIDLKTKHHESEKVSLYISTTLLAKNICLSLTISNYIILGRYTVVFHTCILNITKKTVCQNQKSLCFDTMQNIYQTVS